jgi:hypothetical protein
VDYNWSGNLTPGKNNYSFEPNLLSFTHLQTDINDSNFIAKNFYDLDCDEVITLGDFAVICDNWLMTGPGIAGDLVPDQIINFFDFAMLAYTPPNNPPAVSITSPTNGATFGAPANITINATAFDSDGTVNKVDFYQGSTLLGTDLTSPYSFNWNNITEGNYVLTVVATDDDNDTTTSADVNITVNVSTGCTCAAGCDSRTSISADFVKEGAGEFCFESTNLGTYINSWALEALNINGTSYLNTYVFTSTIPKINGKYYVYYKGSYGWSHFEAKN